MTAGSGDGGIRVPVVATGRHDRAPSFRPASGDTGKCGRGERRRMQTLLLDPADVSENARMPAVIRAVEDAFAAYQRGDTQMPAKSYIDLPQYNGDFRSMPAYMAVRGGTVAGGARTDADARETEAWDAAGIKWVNVHTDNTEQYDLPTVLGTMIYSDPRNAFPLAIMDGTTLTRLRTGAAAAVATDHLAVEDASTLGIVGAGVQSYTQLEGIACVRDIEEVVVADVREEAVAAFVERFEDDYEVRGGTVAEAAACDVLSTVTPVEKPVVPRDALGAHTHVNAMGADAPGKHEHADATLQDAKIVIDDYEQCTHSGEINVPWAAGLLDDDDLDGELGAIVTGEVPGREPGDGVTLFDSTGLAIQDVAAAHVVYEHADENDNGTPFELVDTRVR
jgi:alanine dehydrogenase